MGSLSLCGLLGVLNCVAQPLLGVCVNASAQSADSRKFFFGGWGPLKGNLGLFLKSLGVYIRQI